MSLTPELRRAVAAKPRPEGYTAPPTGDVNQSEPFLDTSEAKPISSPPPEPQVLRAGAGGYARRDRPNDFVRGTSETYAVVTANEGDEIQLTAEATNNYVVDVLGDCTITPNAVSSPVSENPDDVDAPMRERGTYFVVHVVRHGGAEVAFTGVKWGQAFIDGDGATVTTPLDPQIDCYVLRWVPGGVGWVGTLIDANIQAI
jgi:hypothetical protein